MSTFLKNGLALFFGAAFTLISGAQSASDLRRVIPFLSDLPPLNDYREQMYFVSNGLAPIPGQGWDSYLSESHTNTCITGKTSDKATIQSKKENILIIRDSESFFSSLELSVGGAYGAFSGSGTFNKALKKTRDEQLILANVDRSAASTAWIPNSTELLELTAAAKKLLKSTGSKDTQADRIQRFRAACGDSYIVRVLEGVFWVGRFAYKLNEEEMKQEIELKAKANFGVGSASASAKSVIETKKTDMKAETSSEQIGGKPSPSISTLTEMQNRYQALSGGEDVAGAPYKIAVRSYRSSGIQGWPDDLKDVYMPTVSSLQILGHSERLDALAAVYRDASVEPRNYYFPFIELPTTSDLRNILADSADALSNGAACLRNIEAYCLVQTVCNTDVFKNSEFITRACPALNDPSESFRGELQALIFGSVDPSKRETVERNLLEAIRIRPASGQSPISISRIEIGEATTPAYKYYKYLAAAPLRRDRVRDQFGVETGLNITDDTRSFDTYCKALNLSCGSDDLNKTDASNETKESLRNWTLKLRLAPEANIFAKADHPMNISSQDLIKLTRELSVTLGAERNFTPLKTPPPAVIVEAPPVKPKEYREPRCSGGRLQLGAC